jgi:hypothetical protein
MFGGGVHDWESRSGEQHHLHSHRSRRRMRLPSMSLVFPSSPPVCLTNVRRRGAPRASLGPRDFDRGTVVFH